MLFSSHFNSRLSFFLDFNCLDREKEKQEDSSPREVLDVHAKDLESETTSHEDSVKESEDSCKHPRASQWRNFFKLWSKKSMKRLASYPPLGVPRIQKVEDRSERENHLLSDINNIKPSMVNFKFTELQTATNNFSDGS